MPTVAPLIARLAEAFPKMKVPPETFQVYLADLADVPLETLEAAVTRLIRTSEWFPTINAIRAECAEHLLNLPNEFGAVAQIYARIEWARDQGEEGAEEPPAVHPLAKRALDQVGGYPAFRTSSEPGVVLGQYNRIYREMRAAAIRDAQLAPAVGPGSRPRELTP